MVNEITAELARIASELGPALVPASHGELLASITAGVRRLFRAEACSIALITADQSGLVFVAASGGAEHAIVGRQLPLGHGIAGWVAMTGQPLGVAEVDQDPRFAADFADDLGYRPRAILAVPLDLPHDADRRTIGVIEVLDANPPTTERDDFTNLELLTLFATQAALAVETSRVFDQLGRVLFESAARATDQVDLRAVLGQAAANTTGPSAELAELAAAFAELSRLGAPERAAATRLVTDFLAYVRATHGNPVPSS